MMKEKKWLNYVEIKRPSCDEATQTLSSSTYNTHIYSIKSRVVGHLGYTHLDVGLMGRIWMPFPSYVFISTTFDWRVNFAVLSPAASSQGPNRRGKDVIFLHGVKDESHGPTAASPVFLGSKRHDTGPEMSPRLGVTQLDPGPLADP